MSMSHHSPDDAAYAKRFIDQMFGESKRDWPNGRVAGDDDGESAFAIATDPVHMIVKIAFPKPMNWIGLDLKTAKGMRDALSEKINELERLEALANPKDTP